MTSQQPARSRPHLAISEIECRRGGLDYPSWLILDEYNRAQVDKAYDLVTTTPIGAFSPAFVRKIAGVIKETATQRRLRGIVRK
ncbi:MAG: hypothetical protein E5X51_30695 [Mesorhizobium sp.]|nr:MAG: hypothetical protein E5X51_30695 [Mesorhizobium sp.]